MKKIRPVKFLFIISFFFCLFSFVFSEDIYVTGRSNGWPCYWKNGDRVILEENMNASTFSILVDGDDVYVSGWSSDAACYWKNGEKKELTSTESTAYEIKKNKEDIYIVGFYVNEAGVDVACYWKNDEQINLENEINSVASSIWFSGDDTYISGWLDGSACYWKNDELHNIDNEDSEGYSITVFQDDIYISGWSKNDQGGDQACYWKNGEKTFLDNNGEIDTAADYISIFNGDVYIIGFSWDTEVEMKKAWYWKNQERYNLPVPVDGEDQSFSAESYSITVAGENIYFCGYIENEEGTLRACYWKNNELITVKDKKSDENSGNIESLAYYLYVN